MQFIFHLVHRCSNFEETFNTSRWKVFLIFPIKWYFARYFSKIQTNCSTSSSEFDFSSFHKMKFLSAQYKLFPRAIKILSRNKVAKYLLKENLHSPLLPTSTYNNFIYEIQKRIGNVLFINYFSLRAWIMFNPRTSGEEQLENPTVYDRC